MSNKQFAKILSGLSNVSEEACEGVLDVFGDAIRVALESDDKISIKGCMLIELKERGERRGKDLRTGAPKIFPPTHTIMCRINKSIKDDVREVL
jgi:nucleoid DNA-binding protein